MPMPPETDRDDTLPLPVVGDWVDASDGSTEHPILYPKPEPEPLVVHPEPDLEPTFCQRCGETAVPVANCCRWCNAWLVGPRPKATPVYSLDDDEPEDDWDADVIRERYAAPRAAGPLFPPLAVVLVSYGLLLVTLVGSAVVAAIYGLTGEEDIYIGLAIGEVASAVLTFVALGLVWNQARQRVPEGAALPTWALAVPVLTVLLCLNITYITFLRELLRPFGTPQGMTIQVTWITVLLICVQPAIVEELFFRQMTLGVLRRSMNLHAAVWVTGAMFALAHLGNPLGMPYLFLAGGVFGYARAYGGLPLAMLMHFVHNFVVIAYEAWK